MKVTVIGSHLCPDTLYALNKLVEAKADITFQNLSPEHRLICAGGRHRHPGAVAGAPLSA